MNTFDDEKQAARYAGVSVALLRKRRRLRLPPAFVKIGRRVLYSREELDRFLAINTVEPKEQDA